MRDFLHFIKWMVIIGCSLAFAFMALCAAFFYYTMSPTTSIGKYDAVISRMTKKKAGVAPSTQVAHFPDRIPPSATDAKFLLQPAFSDNGYILLLLTLPHSEIAVIEQRLRAEHPTVSATDMFGLTHLIPRAWVAKERLGQTEDNEQSFKKDFILFDVSIPRKTNDSQVSLPDRGVGVSQSRNQVLYWLR